MSELGSSNSIYIPFIGNVKIYIEEKMEKGHFEKKKVLFSGRFG